MARFPGAAWIPSPNDNVGAFQHPGLGVVFHTVASPGLPGQYFQNPASQVSAHFGIGFDGHVEQYVDTDSVAWAEGFEANHRYWSIEFEDGGHPDTPMTAAQIAAGGQVIAWLAGFEHFPIQAAHVFGEQGVLGHVEAWPQGGHTCPNPTRLAQKPALIAAATATIAPQPAPEENVTGWTITDPESGGTWTMDADGSVWARGGAPYCGAPNQHPDWKLAPIVGFTASKDGNGRWGYVVVTRDGTPIGPNTIGAAPGDIHRYYQLTRPVA